MGKKKRKKSGNFKKSHRVDSKQASENYIFYKLQVVYIWNHLFSNNLDLIVFSKDKIRKHKYLYKIFKLSMDENGCNWPSKRVGKPSKVSEKVREF